MHPALVHRTRHLRRRPRLAIATALAVILYFILPISSRVEARVLVAFDFGATVFLGAIWLMMLRATAADMRRRARIAVELQSTVLGLSAAVAAAVLLAIVFQLHGIKDLPAVDAALRVALAVATILLSWIFMNSMFALDYAHRYYSDSAAASEQLAGGLGFPGERTPDYWDFLYFSFVIGMTFQVSDVQITSHRLRRVALAHGVLAFFFNVAILALTINIVAGLI